MNDNTIPQVTEHLKPAPVHHEHKHHDHPDHESHTAEVHEKSE